jgi:hypothetical protein
MLVNGRPLIQHALEHARKDWGAEELIIVASPDNVKAIVEVTERLPGQYVDHAAVDFIIQPRARDILDAIKRGLRMAHHDRILILCADNTFSVGGGSIDDTTKSWNLIACRDLDTEEAAKRFTQLVPNEPDMNTHKGWTPTRNSKSRRVWIGPLLLDRQQMTDVFDLPGTFSTIEDFIMMCTSMGSTLVPFFMQCEDFGVPEMLA